MPGGVLITARSGSVSATFPLTARPHVATIAVTPATDTHRVGEVGAIDVYLLQLTVSVLDPRGQEIVGRIVTYETSNPNVATVEESGIVTGVAAGEAMLTATCEGKSGSAKITVP